MAADRGARAALRRLLLLLAVGLVLVGGAPRVDVTAQVAATSASDAVAPCALALDDHEVATDVSPTAHQQCLRAPSADVADAAVGHLTTVGTAATVVGRDAPWTWAAPPVTGDGAPHLGSRAPPRPSTA